MLTTISNEEIIRKVTEVVKVTKLPCPIEFMNLQEYQAWMNIDFKERLHRLQELHKAS